MNPLKTFDRGLGKNMPKATNPLGGVDSSNPRHWRGWRLHHHSVGVCCVYVLCVAVSSGRHLSCVDKYHTKTLRWGYRHCLVGHPGLHHTRDARMTAIRWPPRNSLQAIGLIPIWLARSFAETHTAMPPLIFAPTLGYIGCPDVRVRHRLPR